MTIAELRERLSAFPDTAIVLVRDAASDEYTEAIHVEATAFDASAIDPALSVVYVTIESEAQYERAQQVVHHPRLRIERGDSRTFEQKLNDSL